MEIVSFSCEFIYFLSLGLHIFFWLHGLHIGYGRCILLGDILVRCIGLDCSEVVFCLHILYWIGSVFPWLSQYLAVYWKFEWRSWLKSFGKALYWLFDWDISLRRHFTGLATLSFVWGYGFYIGLNWMGMKNGLRLIYEDWFESTIEMELDWRLRMKLEWNILKMDC